MQDNGVIRQNYKEPSELYSTIDHIEDTQKEQHVQPEQFGTDASGTYWTDFFEIFDIAYMCHLSYSDVNSTTESEVEYEPKLL